MQPVFFIQMGRVGIEPTRVFSPEDFKSPASACSATAPILPRFYPEKAEGQDF